MKIKLLIEGGNMTPGPAIAQQLGPMGINIGKVISDINKATLGFKGTKVPVELNVDAATKEFIIIVKSPPVAELLKKEAGMEKGSGDHKNFKSGNISIEQIIKISKTKLPEMLERNLKQMVKTVVGTSVSLGLLIDSKDPIVVAKEVESGVYDKEIKQEKTEPTSEKISELKEYYAKIKSAQEAKIKQEEAAKAAKEETETKNVEAAVVDAKAVLAVAGAKAPAKTPAKTPVKAAVAKPTTKK